MSYAKLTSFAVKDTMADTNPLKVVRGKEFDDEFDAIALALTTQEQAVATLVAVPTGTITMYGATGSPVGFLPCDGTTRSRSTYAALFNIIGTTYGAGDSYSTFHLPNLVGRFPFGGTLGQTGGSAEAPLPEHTHTATVTLIDPGHVHTISPNAEIVELNASGTAGSAGGFTGGQGLIIANSTGTKTTGITATATLASAGTTVVDGNMPPFVGLSFIIKT